MANHYVPHEHRIPGRDGVHDFLQAIHAALQFPLVDGAAKELLLLDIEKALDVHRNDLLGEVAVIGPDRADGDRKRNQSDQKK
ncbi:hypothetical protein A6070_10935 [Syntrophotalea acetylenica]|nr:hypothetical protein A6070_10935 [Syntrophotalea acetylenica]